MNVQQDMVWDFHAKFGFTRNLVPTQIDPTLGLVRHGHTLEEMGELEKAIMSGDLVAIADSLCDVLYFVIGTGVAYGIPLENVFAEVHRSNMTKETPEGGGDAKAVKGKDYSPPDIVPIIEGWARLTEKPCNTCPPDRRDRCWKGSAFGCSDWRAWLRYTHARPRR